MSQQMAIEDSVMYDMATWSAPLAYNLECYSSTKNISVSGKAVTLEIKPETQIKNINDAYAYIIDWNQRNAPTALALLWEKGYKVRSAIKEFNNEGKSYAPGSLIVLVGRNFDKKDQIASDMAAISAKAEVGIEASSSGRSATGIDLASRDSKVLKSPKVAMLVEPPFDTYTCGQIYFLFDQETSLPVDRIRTSILKQTSLPKLGSRYGYADLEDYDVLILADGGENLKKVFDAEALEELKEWVKDGGTIVATESAATFLSEKEWTGWKVKSSSLAKDSSLFAATVVYKDRIDFYGKKEIPGTALNSRIDISHPLAFGLKPELYTIKFGNEALLPTIEMETVGQYSSVNHLMASGYASKESLAHLSKKPFAGVARIGQGKIVYLLDNTQYRMFWRGPSRMMQNAVMLMPSM
jgi:hypothetical protein